MAPTADSGFDGIGGHKVGLEPSVVRAQVSRIEHSSTFADSARLLALLRFLVEKALKGEAASLKESNIGNAIYGRSPPYDPRIDSTVRVEARRLRRKLQEYYSLEGQCDPVAISVPTGAYVPLFEAIAVAGTARQNDEAEDYVAVVNNGAGADPVIIPFRPQSREPADVSVELTLSMGRPKSLRDASQNVGLGYKDNPALLAWLIGALGFDEWLQGAIRPGGRVVRITIELSDARDLVPRTDRSARASEGIARPRLR